MRKRGKVKIVLTVFIIVLFSCTAVIGNSRTGVIENVMAKNAADVDILTIKSRVFTGEEIIKAWLDTDTLDEVSFNNVSEVIAREEKKGRKLISKEKAIRACLDNYFWDQNAENEAGVLVEEASCDMEYLMIDKGSENDESVCDIGYYVQIPMSDTDGGNQYVIEGFVDGEYPYCYATAMTANVNQTDQSE